METPSGKMNNQTRLAEDYRRQLNRFRGLLQCTPQAEPSNLPLPSASPTSMQAFASFLMGAQTEEQVRSYILANQEVAIQFARRAATWGGLEAPYPPEQLHAVDEANLPFHILGWLQGGDLEKTV